MGFNKSEPVHVLFVCTGNTCRSPMAAAIFSRLAKAAGYAHAEISSAGLSAVEGQPAAANAVDACAEIGLDLSGHRTRRIAPRDFTENDLLVACTPTHAYILQQAGAPKEKIVLLGEIRDPFGEDLEIYRECREELTARLKWLIGQMTSHESD